MGKRMRHVGRRRVEIGAAGALVALVGAGFLFPFLDRALSHEPSDLWPNPLFLVPLGTLVFGLGIVVAMIFVPDISDREQRDRDARILEVQEKILAALTNPSGPTGPTAPRDRGIKIADLQGATGAPGAVFEPALRQLTDEGRVIARRETIYDENGRVAGVETVYTSGERDAVVMPETVAIGPPAIRAPTRTPAIQPPPVDPGPDLPARELTSEEKEFLFAPTARPDEPITTGLDRRLDPVLSQALGQARKAASAIRALVDEVHLPPLDALRDSRKSAMWKLQEEQATLGRYMNKLHGHVLVAVDGLRPYASHDELDRLYRNPRNTGDLRTIASLLDAVADVVTPRP